MSRMIRIRYTIAAAILAPVLWAQSPAPPAPQSPQPDSGPPPATSASPAPTASAPTPPPDSTVLIVTKKVKPDYPAAALPDKLQGQVVVRIVVDEDGDVESTQVISGNPVLAQAAVDALKQWKFQPFIRNGQAVKAAIKEQFDFAPPADAAAEPKTGDAPDANLGAPMRVRVSSGVTQGLLIHRVEPTYPGMALHDRVQGSVVLGAVISKEGTIKDLHVISGDPLLNKS